MNDFENEEMLENEEQENVEETKSEKFKRLSAFRIQKASKYISAIGNLSNKSSYEYSSEDIEKIFSYLQKQLDDAKAKFAVNGKDTNEFSW